MVLSLSSSLTARNSGYKPGLFIFSVFAAAWAVLLLYAGGFTTSIQAGMAFLDWPLSNGSINPDGWLTESDKLAEHSHRLMGAKLGFLAIISALWHFFKEERKRVRLLSYALFWLVVSQGLLGGLRVLLDQLNTGFDSNVVAQSFAVAHACGAQLVFCTLIAIAVLHSPFWLKHGETPAIDYAKARVWGIAAVVTLFLQILIGAIMRHSHAGLAIPTFPLSSEDSLLPPFWSFPIAINFAHRVGAALASIALIGFVVQIFKNEVLRSRLLGNAIAVMGVLSLQIYLGALTVWTVKNPHAATMHMLVGAFLMGSTWMLLFRLYRYPLMTSSKEEAGQPVDMTASSA